MTIQQKTFAINSNVKKIRARTFAFQSLFLMAAVLLARGVLASTAEVNYGGKVVDEYRRPIAGARVAIIGTPLSVTADSSGTFAVKGTASDLRPLEFTAEGCFARTLIPESANMLYSDR